METVGASDAKTRLAELLDRVARGETFVITKRGHPVARLLPVTVRTADRTARAVDRLKLFHHGMPCVEMRDLLDTRHEGHRY